MLFYCFEILMVVVMLYEIFYKECYFLIYREDKMLEVILIFYFFLFFRVSKYNIYGVNISYRGG